MKKINFKLILKRFTHWLKRIGSDADSDWKLALSGSIIIFICMIVLSLQMFFLVQHQKETGASTQSKNTGFIDAKSLMGVLGKYSEREKEYAALAATTTPFIDPSL